LVEEIGSLGLVTCGLATSHCTRLPVWEKFKSDVAAKSEFNRFVNLVKKENMRQYH